METNKIEQYKQDIIAACNRYFESYNSKELEPLYSKVGELLRNRNSYQFFVKENRKPIIVIGEGYYITYTINVRTIVATVEFREEGNKVIPFMDFVYTYKFSATGF